MKKQLHDYKGYTAFERLPEAADRTNPLKKLNEHERSPRENH